MAQLVKVTGIINATESPTGKVLRPGDWVEVKNRETLARWIADGKCEAPHWLQAQAATAIFSDNCGVLVRSKKSEKVPTAAFGEYKAAISIEYSTTLSLPFKHTLLWSPSYPLTKPKLIIGFSLISSGRHGYDSWDMAACLISETMLANSVGGAEERSKTAAVVGDNRLPIYDTRAVWIKRSKKTEAIIAAMQADLEDGADEQHAFLRALYGTPIKLCTLPVKWLTP